MKEFKLWSFILTMIIIFIIGISLRINAGGSNTTFTKEFCPIENNLYYCRDTGIVYWVSESKSTMIPYYAPNGLPYLYVEGKLEEIENYE